MQGLHLGGRVGSAGTPCPGPDGAGSCEGGEGQRGHLLSRAAQNEGKGLGEVSTPHPGPLFRGAMRPILPGRALPLRWGVSSVCSHEPDRLPLQTERDFFGRVVTKRAAALSAGVCGLGAVEGGPGQAEDQPCGPTEDTAPETDTVEWRMGTAVGRSDVWFRFKEGVSNAVRRNLHIRDLL